jgi:hypothetical protein
MSAAPQFDIESPASISMDSSKIRCDIISNILNESSILSRDLIGSRLQLLTKAHVIAKAHEKEKTSLELMEDLGLLGVIEDGEVTSENYKEFIEKSFRNHHGSDS